jgi:hypothetical protein
MFSQDVPERSMDRSRAGPVAPVAVKVIWSPGNVCCIDRNQQQQPELI